jgi:hypothetical protein
MSHPYHTSSDTLCSILSHPNHTPSSTWSFEAARYSPRLPKAFETSQTHRRATREIGIDLTPWIDAPAATRAKRIMEAAKGFWGSLDDEQRRAVDEAWGERVEFPPRWPQLSS